MPSKPRTSSTTTATETTQEATPSRGTSVNRVTLVGRLVAAPELRTTATGIHVTTVRVVTNDREQPEFHDVVLWRQLADFATRYMGKGSLVYIEGRSQTRRWEGIDGTNRRSTEILAERFQALSPKRPAEATA